MKSYTHKQCRILNTKVAVVKFYGDDLTSNA